MSEAFIVRRGGGGGSGGTLVVTSSGAGTVTVSNSTLGKSYSKSVTAGGSVTFKGLKTGEWTVTLSNGTQTATKTIGITADYAITIAFFSASINITYPATSTCVVTNSGGQTVASDTNTGSSTKTWTATVDATGTYTVTVTSTIDGSKTKSVTVSITADGQSESVTLTYELTIFKAGSGFADGLKWTVSYDKMFTVTDDSIFIDGNIGYGCINVTPVNVSSYSTMWVEAEVGNYGDPINFGIGADLNDNEAMKSMPANQSRRTFSLDISSFTGEKTLFLDSDTGGGTVYNWWLE